MTSRATALLRNGTLMAFIRAADWKLSELKELASAFATLCANRSDNCAGLAEISVRADEIADDFDNLYDDSATRAAALAEYRYEEAQDERAALRGGAYANVLRAVK